MPSMTISMLCLKRDKFRQLDSSGSSPADERGGAVRQEPERPPFEGHRHRSGRRLHDDQVDRLAFCLCLRTAMKALRPCSD